MIENFSYTGNSIKEEVVTTSAISREIKDKNSKLIATLSAEPYNGKAEVEYQGVVRTLFEDTRYLFYECEHCYVDNAINAVAIINGTRYTFVRGVAQHGESSVAKGFEFMTTLPRLRWYEGYELGVAYAADDLTGSKAWNVCLNGHGLESGGHGKIEDMVLLFLFEANTHVPDNNWNGTISIVVNGATQPKQLLISTEKIPAHPFYIRWINHLGGYDYFMFACNQKKTRSLTANDYYQPYGSDGVMKPYNKQGKEVVEVSTGQVDKQTLDAIALMPLSPDIRLYKKDTQEWVPIMVESGDTEIMANQPTGELVFSFVVPRV